MIERFGIQPSGPRTGGKRGSGGRTTDPTTRKSDDEDDLVQPDSFVDLARDSEDWTEIFDVEQLVR